jgi:hypothetical protein
MQTRDGLDPHQRRSDQLNPPEALKANGSRRGGGGNAGVDNQPQRPSRDNATAATQFGAGVSSWSFRHSGGSGNIGYISSRTSSSAPVSISR